MPTHFHNLNRQATRELLTGPVPSIRTPFTQTGEIDEDGLAQIVEFLIGAGARSLMLTAGDSHWFCLTEKEISHVTRLVCEQARGRAAVIAADCQHDTRRAVAFAEASQEAGAAIMMVLPPDWGRSCTPASMAEHYAAVAEVLPVMIVTNVFIPRGDAMAAETIARTLETSERVVAIKDDMCGRFAQQLCLDHSESVAILAGGQKHNHLSMRLFGRCGYLSTFMSFQPEVTHRYWTAIESEDWHTASRIVAEIDGPWFKHIGTFPGGFDAAIHGVMELHGLCGRWRRPPYHSLSNPQMQALRQFHNTLLQRITTFETGETTNTPFAPHRQEQPCSCSG